jgi:uncharacterized membrane protein
LIVLLTVAALALRFYRLAHQSLWIDEVASILTARVPMDHIAEQSALNNGLPTFFMVLRWALGGASEDVEFRARAVSALAGTLTVPVLIGVVYLWRQRWGTALLAGALLAINPLHLWYSQEVRAYALMLLFGSLTLLCYELARRRPRSAGWWMGYSLCALGAIALHKTAIVFPIACYLWHLWSIAPVVKSGEARLGRTLWPLLRKEGFATLLFHNVVLIIAICVLWPKANLPPQEFMRANSILEIGYTFMTFVGGYSFGPAPADIQNWGAAGAIARHAIQTLISCASLVLVLAACLKLVPRKAVPAKELSLLVLSISAVGLGALLSGFPYNIRYALPALLGFVALTAAIPARPFQNAISRSMMLGLILISLWGDAQWFFSPVYRKADSRAVAQWLVSNEAHIKTWTILPNYLNHALNWYLHEHPEIVARLLPAEKGNTTEFPPVPDVLIISRRHHILNPDQLINSYRAAAGKTRTINSFAGFELYVRDGAE